MERENSRVAFCLGDKVMFGVISDNIPYTAFKDCIKVYLYNSVKYYEIPKGEWWIKKDEDPYVMHVAIPPEKTEKMLPGDYNLVIKGCVRDVIDKSDIETSARIMNAICLDWSPARKDHFSNGELPQMDND